MTSWNCNKNVDYDQKINNNNNNWKALLLLDKVEIMR